jgi:hypothetical protein
MDHDALSDMGMSSLGHRLKVLRAVWEVKKEQGIEIGDEDWKPAGESDKRELLVKTHANWLDMPNEGPKREVMILNDAIQELREFQILVNRAGLIMLKKNAY